MVTETMVGFDADGTFIDSLPAHMRAINYILRSFGKKELTVAEFLQRNKDYRTFYTDLGIDVSLDELQKIYRPKFREAVVNLRPPLVENAGETFCYLIKRGCRLALITAQQEETIYFYDSYTSFLTFFRPRIYFAQYPLRKYNILKEIKERDPDHRKKIYIYVSDTPDDLEDAQRAGWKVYGINKIAFASTENLKAAIHRGQGALLQDIIELKMMFQDEPKKDL